MIEKEKDKKFCRQIPLKVSIFFRLSCETVLFLMFFFNFTRESGERPSKIDPLVHAQLSDSCVTLGQPNDDLVHLLFCVELWQYKVILFITS